jgi:hypothetical protein
MLKRGYLLLVVCVCLFVPNLLGQSAQPPTSSEGWRVRVTPYLWGSGLKGRIGIRERFADVDASFGDIFDRLNFGFTGLVDAGRDRFTILTDLVYMNLSDDRATAGPLFSSVDATQKFFVLAPLGGYRVAGSEDSSLDLLGGIRFWHMKGELEFEPGLLEERDVSGSRNWVDGIFGLRGRYRLTSSWSISGYGDIGGGGSNLTYQILGAASADLGNRIALVFGYRYLNVVYNKDRFLFDTGMGGPVLGVAFKF